MLTDTGLVKTLVELADTQHQPGSGDPEQLHTTVHPATRRLRCGSNPSTAGQRPACARLQP